MIVKESPLKGINVGNAKTISIRELPGLSTFDLRVKPGSETQMAIAGALAIEFPNKTRQAKLDADGESYILCLAPDNWLLVGMKDIEGKLAALKLNDEYHFSMVDVSGQRTTIELEGPNAPNVIAHLWEQDLRDKTFPAGCVSQGLMVKAPVILIRTDVFKYRIMVRSSFALHFWKALEDAAVEYL